MKLLELTDDLAISPRHVTAVRRNKLSKKDDTCTLFLEGLQAHEGFTIDMPWEDCVDAINQALADSSRDKENDSTRD
jgi:hypothetical protein